VLPKLISRVFLTGALLLVPADFAAAQVQASISAFAAPVDQNPIPTALPQLHGFFDAALSAGSLAGIAIGLELPVTRQSVPAQGLDPSTIGWAIDRDVVGHPSTSADTPVASAILAMAAPVPPSTSACLKPPSAPTISITPFDRRDGDQQAEGQRQADIRMQDRDGCERAGVGRNEAVQDRQARVTAAVQLESPSHLSSSVIARAHGNVLRA